MGAGAGKRLSAVRWGVAGNIVVAWLLTLPAAAAIGALVYGFVDLFPGAVGPVLVSRARARAGRVRVLRRRDPPRSRRRRRDRDDRRHRGALADVVGGVRRRGRDDDRLLARDPRRRPARARRPARVARLQATLFGDADRGRAPGDPGARSSSAIIVMTSTVSLAADAPRSPVGAREGERRGPDRGLRLDRRPALVVLLALAAMLLLAEPIGDLIAPEAARLLRRPAGRRARAAGARGARPGRDRDPRRARRRRGRRLRARAAAARDAWARPPRRSAAAGGAAVVALLLVAWFSRSEPSAQGIDDPDYFTALAGIAALVFAALVLWLAPAGGRGDRGLGGPAAGIRPPAGGGGDRGGGHGLLPAPVGVHRAEPRRRAAVHPLRAPARDLRRLRRGRQRAHARGRLREPVRGPAPVRALAPAGAVRLLARRRSRSSPPASRAPRCSPSGACWRWRRATSSPGWRCTCRCSRSASSR